MSTDPLEQLLARPVYQLPGLSAGTMGRLMNVLSRAIAEWDQGVWEPVDGAPNVTQRMVDMDSPLRTHHGPPATVRHLVEFWPASHLYILGLSPEEVSIIVNVLDRVGLRLPSLAEAQAFHEQRQDDAAGGRSEVLSPVPWIDPAGIFRTREPGALYVALAEFRAWLVEVTRSEARTVGELELMIPQWLATAERGESPVGAGVAGFYLELGLQDGRVMYGYAGYVVDRWTSIVAGDLRGLVAAATPAFELRLLPESQARQEWIEGFMLRAAKYEHDPQGPIGCADGLWLPNRQANGSVFQAQARVRERKVQLGP